MTNLEVTMSNGASYIVSRVYDEEICNWQNLLMFNTDWVKIRLPSGYETVINTAQIVSIKEV